MDKIICKCYNLTKEDIINEIKTTGETRAGKRCLVCRIKTKKIIKELR